MTKTYYDDPLVLELDTNVVSCKEDKGEYLVALEETLFYVEGGGQLRDEGWINDIEVIDVYTYKDTIYHVLKQPVEGKVHIRINGAERLKHMQSHTTQHLVSAVFVEQYDYWTIGNHYMSDGTCDIDLDCEGVTKEQLQNVENICNQIITMDLPIEISYVDEKLARSYAEAEFDDYEDLDIYRVVSIPGYKSDEYLDHNLCGCLHVPSTRYIKGINLLSATKTAQGVRIIMSAGNQLVENAHTYYDMLNSISTNLGKPFNEINDGIEHLRAQYREESKLLDHYRTSYLDLVVKNTLSTLKEDEVNLIVVDEKDFTIEDMKYVMVNYTKEPNNIAVGMKEENNRLSLVISKSKNVENFNCGNVFKELRKNYKLRGGGSPLVAQGGGEVFDDYKTIILDEVKAQLEQSK